MPEHLHYIVVGVAFLAFAGCWLAFTERGAPNDHSHLFTSLTDLEICTLALCATITVCTIGAVFVVVSVMVGVIENSTKRLVHAAWHGPNNAGMNLAVGVQLEAQR